MRAIQAMLWKEWRENARWSALAFLALSLATFYSTSQSFSVQQPRPSLNLFEPTAPLTITLVPLLASVLGLLQVGGELRRDQWAFLVHRPVSRGVLFGGKALAGLALYFAATLTPMLILAWWMQTPGHLAAPFSWGLMLAPLANILAGAAFYFAAMLTAIRAARWWGSRGLGFVLALGGLLGANFVSEFWQALLFLMATWALLGLAAWGSFLTAGTYERQPKIAKIALGTTLYLSIAIVVGGLTAWAVSAAAQRERQADFATRPPYRWTQYSIDQTGRILRVTRGEGKASAFDLQGREVVLRHGNVEELEKTSLEVQTNWSQIDNFRSTIRYYEQLAPSSYEGASGRTKPHWFYLQSQRRLVCYDPQTKRLLGTMGPRGYTSAERGVAAPFSEPRLPSANGGNSVGVSGESVQYARFPHSIYRLDLQARTATRLYQSASSRPLGGVALINGYSPKGGFALVDGDIIRFLSKTGQPLFSTPLERKDSGSFSLSVSTMPNGDRFFLSYEHYPQADESEPRQSHISEFSSQGVLLAKHTLPPLPDLNDSPGSTTRWYETAALVAEVPPALVTGAIAHAVNDRRLHPSRIDEARWSELRLLWLANLGAGFLWANLAFFVTKRCGLSPRACRGWSFAVGALGLFALRPWPARVRCPSCARKRGIDRERCEHCGAPIPAPPLDETSIFEDHEEPESVGRAMEHV